MMNPMCSPPLNAIFGEFDVVVAKSGEAGLDAVRWGEKFAVIVSDMRMPGMDGATFLAKAREISPDSVRILLTGQADVQSSLRLSIKGPFFAICVSLVQKTN
jgi:CheY-like chemotaxis protein